MAVLLLGSLLTACSEDADGGRRPTATFEVKAGTTVYSEQAAGARSMSPFTTRTDDPSWIPGTYTSFENLNSKFRQQKNLVNASIDVFFTQDTKPYKEGVFFYLGTLTAWRLSMEIEEQGDYYLYGFIPREDAESASIVSYNGSSTDGNNSYSKGAVLTINNLNTVTPSDVCVIVGAKDGDATTVSGLTEGQFKVHAKAATREEEETNFIYLLFDHLYTTLLFNFTIDAKYDKLRTIKLRKLEMRACNNNFTRYIPEHCDATVTLQANTTTPIKSVSFDFGPLVEISTTNPDAGYKEIYKYVESSNNEVVLEHDKVTEFLGCLVPGSSYNFQLRSTYDVYDKNITPGHPEGNLIRKDCQAVNNLKVVELFGEQTTLQRGKSYSLTMKVQPTYLYMLSEPDLDNPTVDVGH